MISTLNNTDKHKKETQIAPWIDLIISFNIPPKIQTLALLLYALSDCGKQKITIRPERLHYFLDISSRKIEGYLNLLWWSDLISLDSSKEDERGEQVYEITITHPWVERRKSVNIGGDTKSVGVAKQ